MRRIQHAHARTSWRHVHSGRIVRRHISSPTQLPTNSDGERHVGDKLGQQALRSRQTQMTIRLPPRRTGGGHGDARPAVAARCLPHKPPVGLLYQPSPPTKRAIWSLERPESGSQVTKLHALFANAASGGAAPTRQALRSRQTQMTIAVLPTNSDKKRCRFFRVGRQLGARSPRLSAAGGGDVWAGRRLARWGTMACMERRLRAAWTSGRARS